MAIAITNIGIGSAPTGATGTVTVGAGGVPSGTIIVIFVGEAKSVNYRRIGLRSGFEYL